MEKQVKDKDDLIGRLQVDASHSEATIDALKTQLNTTRDQLQERQQAFDRERKVNTHMLFKHSRAMPC